MYACVGEKKDPDPHDGMDANRNNIDTFDVDSMVTVDPQRRPNNIRSKQTIFLFLGENSEDSFLAHLFLKKG